MGRYFALTLNFAGEAKTKPNKKKTLAPNARGSLVSFGSGVWILVLLLLTGGLYLVEVNSLSTKGYEIKLLEQRLVEFKESNARLELEAATMKSIERLQSEVETLNLVPSGKVDYVRENGYAFKN